MQKNKVLAESAIILALAFALIVICENILKESSIFNIVHINILLFGVVSGASAYYFYSISSNLSLYLSFGRTRKELFSKSLINGSIVLGILFVLSVFSVITNILFKKEGLSLTKVYVESKILYLVMNVILFAFLGNLVGLVSKNKYVNHSLLIIMLFGMFSIALIFNSYIVNLVGIGLAIVNLILFIILRHCYFNHHLDI